LDAIAAVDVTLTGTEVARLEAPTAPTRSWATTDRTPEMLVAAVLKSGYPGGMLAFIRKKFVGSYLALRAVSRAHCWPVYA
jgi:hypothetical protein